MLQIPFYVVLHMQKIADILSFPMDANDLEPNRAELHHVHFLIKMRMKYVYTNMLWNN